MKEIRAYIRRDAVNELAEKLRAAGAHGVSIIEIHPLGYGYDANPFERFKAGIVDRYRYLTIVKLEIVCRDDLVERVIATILAHARTGLRGDGKIYLGPVDEAIRIATGERGRDAM